ncbi:MAG: hypothetical protein BGO70_17245 [Bacteroidetes bacterium 43-93]|nr:hypothetical protein [Bacteroidota bacterium]OJX01496.1 MAG: hypothetical protein BGO70_17245 [Bacteroidetes bacterium 43-93]
MNEKKRITQKALDSFLLISFVFFAFFIIINIFFIYRYSIYEFVLILFGVIILFMLGIRKKRKRYKDKYGVQEVKPKIRILYLSTSIFILLKGIVLPLMFLYAVNYTYHAVKVDPDIEEYERQKELSFLDQYFKLIDTQKIILLRKLLNSNHPDLYKDRQNEKSSLNLTTVYPLDTFVLEEKQHIPAIIGDPKCTFFLKDKKGKEITHITISNPTDNFGGQPRPPNKTIRESDTANEKQLRYVILKTLEELEYAEESTKSRRLSLESKSTKWTYAMMLPYIVFDSEYIHYQSPLTISVYGISKIICDALLLAIIGTVVYDIISGNKKQES